MNASIDPGAVYREAPHNEEAEQALLGAILMNNRAYEKVSEFLRSQHFYDPGHQRIYEVISKSIEEGRTANPVTLKTYLDNDPEFSAEGGGGAYLAQLAAGVVTVVNAADYGKQIHEAFVRRQAIEVAVSIMEEAYHPTSGRPPEAAIAEFTADLDRILDIAPSAQASFTSMREGVAEAIARSEAAAKSGGGLSGLSTGLIDLDKLTGGFQPTDLIIIAGRPSMGKTTICKNIAVTNAKRFKAGLANAAPVGFFSLEMSAEQLAANYLAEETGIATPKQRQGHLTDDDFVRLTGVDPDIPIYIDTTADSLPALISRAKRMVRKHGVGLLAIDYIQLLTSGSRSENRNQEVTEISRALKKLARELNVPVVGLSQLSRKVEEREEKRPMLSDLRESGSIEQDADVVIFAFREEYYLERAEPSRKPSESDDKYNARYASWQQRLDEARNIGEFIIAKQRMGPIGAVRAHFDGGASKFSDLATGNR